MAQTKHCHDDLGHQFRIFLAGHALESARGRAHGSGKLKRLPDGQMGEMLLDLLVVKHLTLELLHHGVLRNAAVVDFGFVVEFESMELSGESLEKGTASGPRTTQHDKKLTTVQDTIKLLENLLGCLGTEVESFAWSKKSSKQIRDRHLQLQRRASTRNPNILKKDAGLLTWDALVFQQGQCLPEPFVEIEVFAIGVEGRILRRDVGERIDELNAIVGASAGKLGEIVFFFWSDTRLLRGSRGKGAVILGFVFGCTSTIKPMVFFLGNVHVGEWT